MEEVETANVQHSHNAIDRHVSMHEKTYPQSKEQRWVLYILITPSIT